MYVNNKIRLLILKKFLTRNLITKNNINTQDYKLRLLLYQNRNFYTRSSHLQKTVKNVYLLDETQNNSKLTNVYNKFTQRTYNCGELRQSNVGEKIVLCGWLEFHRLNKFAVIRDAYGQVQLLIDQQDVKTQELLSELPYESVVKVKGTVLSRPNDMVNKKQLTGEIEVLIEQITVLNRANQNLPFNIRDFQKAKEPLRMHYRYMDLRFPEMQRNLRIRSQFLMNIREFLIKKCGFVDVETPTLFKATPGGAQEFIVPTRFPGQFYSLVQSPQQFKQMLMAGGIDRYFQIARCYRDEGCRSDRQPEFTQLDIEMSFTNSESIMSLIEELLHYAWPDALSPFPLDVPKLTYDKVMRTFGSDKPDTRFKFHLQNCSHILETNSELLTENFGAYCLVFREPFVNLTKAAKESFAKLAQEYSKSKFILSKINNVQEWSTKIETLLGHEVTQQFIKKMNLTDNCILFLAYGNLDHVLPLLGLSRLRYVNILEEQGHKIRKEGFHPLWVTDFPLFEAGDLPNNLNSAHHPFTAPNSEDLHLLEKSPLKVKAQAYDLVLNGNEVGGGSIRIHDPVQQEQILNALKIDTKVMQYMLNMLGSGCPPHGGIALGLDRLLATMLNTPSIRDVIAFPKNFEGRDPMTGAPSEITENDKILYHINIIDNKG